MNSDGFPVERLNSLYLPLVKRNRIQIDLFFDIFWDVSTKRSPLTSSAAQHRPKWPGLQTIGRI